MCQLVGLFFGHPVLQQLVNRGPYLLNCFFPDVGEDQRCGGRTFDRDGDFWQVEKIAKAATDVMAGK